MVKKMRRVRTFARTASKSMEKKLIENAKQLMKDPYLILPDYSDNYSDKIFKKIKKSLDKTNRFKDEPKKLEKLALRRDLAGAFAGTLLLAHSEKAPYLAVAKFPTGDITYAQRGRADKEKLIAVQHFDDPILRILGIKDFSIKKKLHIYSWDEGYFSSGIKPEPPEDFVNFIVKKTKLSLKNGILCCGDIDGNIVKSGDFSKKNYLRINWKSAGIIIAICQDCAKSSKNTMFNITKYILQSDISDDFEIKVVGKVVKKGLDEEHSTQHINEYLSGEITDIDFIKKNMQRREEDLKDSEEKIFILDGNSYGTDVDEFIKALKPNKYEKEGLKLILAEINEPVVVDNTTPNKVLERYWKKHGLTVIDSILDDEKTSKDFFSLDETPSEILQLVFNYRERQKILSQLPRYKSLPPLAKFADNVVRTYKTFGEKKALSEIKKRPDTPKGKSIAYAFLLVFGKGSDKKWQFSQVELEYGEFLKQYAKKLIDSKPDNYHKNLKELLVSSGSSEDVDPHLL